MGALWLSLALPATAQSVPAAPVSPVVAPPTVTTTSLLTRQDTAAAVHELFVSRRTGGAIFTAFGGVFTGLLGASIAQVSDPGSGDIIGAASSIGVMGLMPLGVGISKLKRYSRAQEQQVLTDYALTGKLAQRYKRRLRGNFSPVPGNSSWPELVKPEVVASAPAPIVPTNSGLTAPVSTLTPNNRTRADSLDAVLGLFIAKRFAGQLPALLLTPVGAALAGTSNADGEYNYTTGQFEEREPSTGAVIGGLALAFGGVAYMYIHNAPYSMAKFESLKLAYEGGAPLPATLRAQIKPKHFDQGREWRNKLARKAARKNARKSK